MSDDLHLVNELLAELEGIAIRTSQGSYVKLEDVRRLAEKRQEANAIQAAEVPQKMSANRARGMAREFLREQLGPQSPREPGRSVSASEPQPSSRT
jgi:hypothetical protein